MLFDERVFKRLTSPDAFRGGKELALNKQVAQIEVKRNRFQDFVVTGKVLTSTVQSPQLIVASNRQTVKTHTCTCGLDRDRMCKHVVALGISTVEPLTDGLTAQDRLRSLYARGSTSVTGSATKQVIVQARPSGSGAVFKANGKPAAPAERRVDHPLDEIRFQIKFDFAEDTLYIRPVALYGPFEVALAVKPARIQPEPFRNTRGLLEEPLRDEDVEQEAMTWLKPYLDGQIEAEGWVPIVSEEIYPFLKNVYPDIEFRYPVVIDPSARDVMTVDRAEVEGSWRTRIDHGINLFAFSVDWHCRDKKLSERELRDMVKSGQPYIRGEDGRFIECANYEQLLPLLVMAGQAEQKGDERTLSLFEAPGFLTMLKKSHDQRLLQTDQSFSRLAADLEQARTTQITLPASLEIILRPYQKEGVSWMAFLQKYRFGGILADDMGLGKTIQVLALLASYHEAGPQKTSIIVCPKSLLLMWAGEVEKFTPFLKIGVVNGTADERRDMIRNATRYDLLITSYSLLQRDITIYLDEAIHFSTIVLDEAQSIKNSGTNTAKAVKVLVSDHRLALTGTPLENGVHELWSIFDFLMPGFLGSADAFRERFERPIQDGRKEALEQLKRRIQPFMLRRTKASELKDLPPKIEQTSPCELTSEQLVVYSRTLELVRGDLFKKIENDGLARHRVEVLSALMRLRRICDHPALVDDRLPKTEAMSGKMGYAMELLREAAAGNHKVLLFSQFTSMLDIVREALTEEGIGHCTIEGRTRDRQAEITRFHTDPDATVFLLSLKAGGTGLTLTAADTVILFDPWWNPMAEQQAMDRAHRLGQTKTVNVYKLMTKGTIEEKVFALQEKKREIFEAIMDGGTRGLGSIDWNDLKQLFAI